MRLAIDLLHFPSQVRRVRSNPLPNDLFVLLSIAAGDDEATRQAAETLGRSRETVREAAAFFIVQILLFPEADSYRVLGARPEASQGELRRNMALLLRWLHPDLDPKEGRSVFAARVTRAWTDLKTQERRAAYDRLRHASLANKSLLQNKGRIRGQSGKPRFEPNTARHAIHMVPGHPTRFYVNTGLLRRLLLLLFGRTTP